MKFILLIVAILLVQSIDCRYANKSKRSIQIIDFISNKTLAITDYVIEKGRKIRDFTVKSANVTVSSISDIVSSGIDGVTNYVNDKRTRLKNKLKYYIEKSEKTTGSIYDNIAPEKDEYECSDSNTTKHMTTPELITYHGYYVESHTIVTEDGYLLTVHRIPYSKNNSEKQNFTKTVLLHHGILGTSIDWVIPGPNKSLAYKLSDAGYDVWMTNVRGNTYSRAHVSKTLDSYAFWNFTFHEAAQYDLPAVIDYIMAKKEDDSKISYIGFSMGTTTLFSLLSTKTEYNDILQAGYALAPIVYAKNIKSPFKLLSKFGNNIESFMRLIGVNAFLPRNAVVRYLSKHSCKITHFDEALCEMSMFLLCGHDKEHYDSSLMPLILGHVPAGTSTKTLAHYAQQIRNNGKFQQFDYGVEGNMKQYGQEEPLEYPLHKITLPITLFSAKDDWLSSLEDATNLRIQLAKVKEHYVIPDETFNHLDFLFAKDANTLVYDKVLASLEKSYAENLVQTNIIKDHE